MKSIKKLFSVFLILIIFILSSCSGFISGNEDMVIESITTKNDDDGNVLVTITFTSIDYSPVTFSIPKGDKGDKGDTGISIKEVKTEKIDNQTKVTISFDNDSTPVSFLLNDGVSFSKIVTEVQEDGSYKAYVLFSDGSKEEVFTIPSGVDGNGITSLENEKDDDGNIKLTFHFTKSDDVVVTIPKALDGKEGKGIKSIVSSENDNNYILSITYSDDTKEDFTFTKPTVNTWYSGPQAPSNDLGIDGDFYFNSKLSSVLKKVNGKWISITSLDTEATRYLVTFDLNTTDSTARINEEKVVYDDGLYCNVKINSYFKESTGFDIPTATRDGYKFLGWYSTKDDSPSTAKFDDFTLVVSAITLYAHWEKIE